MARSEAVIVAIDNESIQKLGQWPFPRATFARAFENLNDSPPLAVGLDVMFSEPSRFGVADDAVLAAALAGAAYPIVLPVEATLKNLEQATAAAAISPLSGFVSAPRVVLGHVNLSVDSDGVTRRLPLFVTFQDQKFSSFAEAVVLAAGLPTPSFEERAVVERVVFSGYPGAVRRIPFWRLVLEDGVAAGLAGKLVFIGATAPDLHDEQLVPVSRGVAMPGVEIQVNIADMFVSGYRLRRMEWLYNFIWIMIAAVLPAVLFITTRRSLQAAAFNFMIGVVHWSPR